MDTRLISKKKEAPTKVFVYGTLKVGGRFDSGEIRANRRTKSDGIIRGFKMIDLGSFPGIVDSDSENDVVRGELHEFDNLPAVMERLDMIEGYSEKDIKNSLYTREVLEVEDKTTGKKVLAYAYKFNQLKKVGNFRIVKDGNWKL